MNARYAPVMVDHKFSGNYREVKVGDQVEFLCNGKGRGGHHRVTVRVKKIKRVTMDAIELYRSYHPGTPWNINMDTEMTIIEFSEGWKALYADPVFEEGDRVTIDPQHIWEANKVGTVMCKLESEQYRIQLNGRQVNIGPGLLKKAEK